MADPAENLPMVKPEGRYHHGNLKAALLEAAGIILETEGLEELSLRAAARRAGVSQTAPYRHFADREALLVAVAMEGFHMLAEDLDMATLPFGESPREAVVQIGAAYARFATEQPGRFRLMFGRDILNRRDYPDLVRATRIIGERLGDMLGSQALGLAVWGAMHGLAALLVEGVIDLGADVHGRERVGLVPGRVEILLRSLLTAIDEATPR
ncbi:MAG: TetR/AcrR family transcriptional regulator [Alphaproteobacteria bacterium]|nr:TetR/AcrR family transcriptional regulator [Alphaproteobacteria bacterium]